MLFYQYICICFCCCLYFTSNKTIKNYNVIPGLPTFNTRTEYRYISRHENWSTPPEIGNIIVVNVTSIPKRDNRITERLRLIVIDVVRLHRDNNKLNVPDEIDKNNDYNSKTNCLFYS